MTENLISNNLRIGVLGTERFIAGFTLAGIRDAISVNPDDTIEVKNAIQKALSTQALGIIIVQEEVLRAYSNQEKERLLSVLKPVVVLISEKKDDQHVTLARSIKRALGIEIHQEQETQKELEETQTTNPTQTSDKGA